MFFLVLLRVEKESEISCCDYASSLPRAAFENLSLSLFVLANKEVLLSSLAQALASLTR
jgi:hypothetical protein